MLDRELPAGEVALEREVGDAHRRMMPDRVGRRLPRHGTPIVIVGSPTALGGHSAGWSEHRRRCGGGAGGRAAARDRGSRDSTRHAATPPSSRLAADPDPAKNRERDLRVPAAPRRPRRGGLVRRTGPGPPAGHRRRLHVPRRRAGRPAAAARASGWRSPGSTPTATSTSPTPRRRATSGGCRSRWPAAGRPDLVAPATARRSRGDAALLGGQVLDEQESRMLAASRAAVRRRDARRPAGRAALRGWARTVAGRVDGLVHRLRPRRARRVGRLGRHDAGTGRAGPRDGARRGPARWRRRPVVGFGGTAVRLGRGQSERTTDALVAPRGGRARRLSSPDPGPARCSGRRHRARLPAIRSTGERSPAFRGISEPAASDSSRAERAAGWICSTRPPTHVGNPRAFAT